MRTTCPQCKGTGLSVLRKDKPCRTCAGERKVTIDLDAIRQAVRSTQGPNRGKLRVANSGMDNVFGAVYVWRMARFHGGADTTMPIMCAYTIGCGGIQDSYVKAVVEPLDELAMEIARTELGTDMAAAEAWAPVLR